MRKAARWAKKYELVTFDLQAPAGRSVDRAESITDQNLPFVMHCVWLQRRLGDDRCRFQAQRAQSR